MKSRLPTPCRFSSRAPLLALIGMACLAGCEEPPLPPFSTLPPLPRAQDFERRISAETLEQQLNLLRTRPPIGFTQREARERRTRHEELLEALSQRLEQAHDATPEMKVEARILFWQAAAQQALAHPPLSGLNSAAWAAPREAFFQATTEALAKYPGTAEAGEAASLRVFVAGQFMRRRDVDQLAWLQRYFEEVRTYAAGDFPKHRQQALLALSTAARMAENAQLTEQALACYETWRTTYPDDPLVKLIPATLRRLQGSDQPWVLQGQTVAGEPFKLESIRGSWALIVVWRSDSRESAELWKVLRQLTPQYAQRNLQLVGVCLDDNPKAVEQLLAGGQIPAPQLVTPSATPSAPNALAIQIGILPIPSVMLLNPAGQLVNSQVPFSSLPHLPPR